MADPQNITPKEKAMMMYESFRVFMYNKDNGEVMGRNAESWGKIGLFFFVYYACLAAFFAAMFAIAFSTMPDIKDGPKYSSLIFDKPLLLVHPEGVGSWKTKDIDGKIKENYKSILNDYKDTQCYLQRKCAAGESYRPKDEKKQCGFDLTSLGPCSENSTSGFGYNNKSPCLYLKLSKIYGWEPKPQNSGAYIGLSCDVEGDSKTQIEYDPPKEKAFPISFWPFRGEDAFRTPIAAIRVSGNTKEVTIKCKAIAKNIELSDTYKLKRGAYGQVEFTVAAPP